MSNTAYYLQVVRMGEDPAWLAPGEELTVGNQPLGRGYIQYWAYPQGSDKTARDLPPAEIVAAGNPTPKPVIIVDQPGEDLLELILAGDGHAWGKTESNFINLEENLSSILDFAKEKFNISVEHFMTTERVTPLVEKKLDELEGEEAGQSAPGSSVHGSGPSLSGKTAGSFKQGQSLPGSSSGGSKLWIALSVIVLLGMFTTVIIFKDKILAKISPPPPAQELETPTPTPSPQPSPAPISIERGEYKVRVLNGTKRSGAAATLGDQLKEKGWQILPVGNATDSAVAQTQVRVKSGLADVALALVSDLAPELDATSSANLKPTDKADAEVIIGKE